MLTPEQLEMRRTGIGASEAGAVLGLSKWRTPLDVYVQKTTPLVEQESNDAIYFGHLLEDVIAQEYGRRVGREVAPSPGTVRSEAYPWMLATPDRMSGDRLLECKTAGQYMAGEWGESGQTITSAEHADGVVPREYVAQVVHQMVVMDYKRCDLAVLIGGRDFRIYHFFLDDQFAEILIRLEREFWEGNVKAGNPPRPITFGDLATLFPQDSGECVQAPQDIINRVIQFKTLKAQVADMEQARDKEKFAIARFMGDATMLTDTLGEPLVTYKTQTRRALDEKALKADQSEIFDQYMKETTCRVMRTQ